MPCYNTELQNSLFTKNSKGNLANYFQRSIRPYVICLYHLDLCYEMNSTNLY